MKAKAIGITVFVLALVPILLFAGRAGAEAPPDQSAPHALTLTIAQDGNAPLIINEVLPNPGEGDYEWVELHTNYRTIYLPLILRGSSGSAASVGTSAATGLIDISGYQITDEDDNAYTIPDALPAVPLDGYVIIYFDGQGETADDYDFSDGVAVLHTPAGLVGIFEDEADQVSLYTSSTHNSDTILDFVAYGAPPGGDAADAVAAGLWHESWWVSTYVGAGAEEEGAAAVPNRSIGLYPGHDNDSPEDWAVYQGDDRTPGAANPVPGAYWSTVADGAVMGSDGFALGWPLVPGATYQFQMDDDQAFGSPLVDVILDEPRYAPDEPVPAGNYWWRVRAIDARGRAAAWSEPTSVGVVEPVGGHAASDEIRPLATQQVILGITWLRQRKDTPLLCIDGCNEGNPAAPSPKQTWDSMHPDAIFVHGQNNCVRASIAMIVTNYGGNLSQDRLTYQLFENWGNPIEDRWAGVGVGDPTRDLGHNAPTFVCGADGSSARTLLAWALGVNNADITYGWVKPSFNDIRNWIDAGRPVMRFHNGHQTVIGGYRVLGDGTQQIRLFDPWSAATWQNYNTLNITCHYVPPAAAPNVRSDEPGIWTDADGDRIMDWDEQNRFHTQANAPDSDDDWVGDKQDMREYVFDNAGNYNLRNADWDADTLRKELDPDNDGGGTVDGCEDSDYDGRLDAGETNNFNGADDVACVPAFDIRSPLQASPAEVGDKTAPDKLLIRVLASIPPTAGTLTLNTADFDVEIGGDAATILVPPYRVGDEYWLIVQPPAKAAANYYNLSVTLQGTQTDTETNAVHYSDDPREPVDEVLVVDNSGSMADHSKMVSAKNAARAFIDRWKEQDMVGLVVFSTTVRTPFPLTEVTSTTTLTNARAAVNGVSDSPPGYWYTAIGSSLLEAKAQLASGGAGHDQSIILLSDGMENEAPKWSDPASGVQAAFTNCDIKVHTVAIGPSEAAWRSLLQDISTNACNGDGESWHTSGGGTSPTGFSVQSIGFPSNLGNRLADIYLSIAELDARDQRLWEATGKVWREESPHTYQVYVPQGLPEAIWTVNWEEWAPVELRLYYPDGQLVKETDPRVTRIQDTTHDQYRIATPPSGTWRVEIYNPGEITDPEYLAVLSAHSDTQMWLLLGLTPIDRVVDMVLPVNVVLADHDPIAGAVVTASIRAPNEQFDQVLTLYDDGHHEDGKANDGLYGSLYNLDYAGSYTIKTVATGKDNNGEPFERYATRSFYVLPRLAYVYNSADTIGVGAAHSYEQLLEDNGFVVDLVPTGTITASTSFAAYELIVVGPKTGDGSTWGTTGALGAIYSSYKPVIGLGEGGYAFFGQLELDIGYANGWHGSDTEVYVVDTASSVWADPYPITIAGDRRVGVYTTTTHVGIFISVKPDDVTLIGREIDSATHYPIVQQTDRYVLWGFDGSPEAMTGMGKELFVNLAWYME